MAKQFEVQAVDERKERRRRRLKAGGAAVLCVVVLAGASGAAWYFSPPALPETIDEARALVDSPRFQRLSTDDKRVYYDVIREQYGSLDRDERRALRREDEQLSQAMREAWMVQMRERMVTYAEASPDDREELMQDMRRNRPGGDRPRRPENNTPEDTPGRGGEGGDRPDRGERPERTDEERAERAQRMRDRISERMTEGDAQMNQLMREFFGERRRMREQSR
ncbi:MAG: hypothetical protein AAF710_06135 [Planctomycetota bacterium]